jgi:tellurite resistance protein TerC
MNTDLWFWIAFNAGVLFVLAIDLFGFHRKAHVPTMKEAAIWTGVWVVLSLGLNAIIWHWKGPGKGLEFLTGYLVEYSLSVDNIFVILLIFSSFGVPQQYQHRVLFWGILSALVLRGFMIGAGVGFIESFHWALYVFGVFLVFTGVKMFLHRTRRADFKRYWLVRLTRRFVPTTDQYHGPKFTVCLEGGRRMLTPLALVLVVIEATDLLFAVDSIPAILGITRDPFIVYTSNICALLGLRSLYFLLAGLIDRFVYLRPALAIILTFIGVKMLLTDIYYIPTAVSLSVVGLVLLFAIGLSVVANRQNPATAQPATEADRDLLAVTKLPRQIFGMTTEQSTCRPRLSTDLENLHARVQGRPVTLAELKQSLEDRGAAMLLVLLALPFCVIAIPGLSTPFGIAICVIGACLVIGREPWLPRFIMRQRLSTKWSSQLLSGAAKVARKIEKFVRPRLGFLHTGPGMRRLIGLAIMIAGLALMLPLPIPFSNAIPSWAILLLAIGMMEKDGLCVLLGHLAAIATWVFIALSSAFAIAGFRSFLDFFLPLVST